jgi:hypothetical protein
MAASGQWREKNRGARIAAGAATVEFRGFDQKS